MVWLGNGLPSVWFEGQGKERRDNEQERTQQEDRNPALGN